MSVIFPPEGKVDTSSPGTHVLIIGVGGYPYLLGGDAERATSWSMKLGQLTSPPLSADAIARWFLGGYESPSANHGFRNPRAPLASVEMLVSPTCVDGATRRPHTIRLGSGGEITIDGATIENIKTAYKTWRERVATQRANNGVFYFCGHGVTGSDDYVLAEDFGKDDLDPWSSAIDIVLVAREMRRATAGTLYFFIDACRQTKEEAIYVGARAWAPIVNFKKPVQCFSRLMLSATTEGSTAAANAGEVSVFTSAFLTALSGSFGEQRAGEGWVVSGGGLAHEVEREVDRLLQQRTASEAAEQHIEEDRIGSQPFHYLPEPPKYEGSIELQSVYEHAREDLETLGGAGLPELVKEVIAERVERGELPVERLQTEIDSWVQALEQWRKRFAEHPDRELTQQANALLSAGKLAEARALFAHALKAARARKVTLLEEMSDDNAGMATTLMLEWKWREALPYLKDAVSCTIGAHTDAQPPSHLIIDLMRLGFALVNVEEFEEAAESYDQALARAQEMSARHGNVQEMVDALQGLIFVGDCLNALGNVSLARRNNDQAIHYYEQALVAYLQIYRKEHPHVARCRTNLGLAWSNKGDQDRAIDYFKLALDSLEQYPEEHRRVAQVRIYLGTTWCRKGEYDKAIECFEQARASDVERFGEEHPDVVRDYDNLGYACHKKGDYDKATEYTERALAGALKIFGEGHRDVAQARSNLRLVWKAKAEYDKALRTTNGPSPAT